MILSMVITARNPSLPTCHELCQETIDKLDVCNPVQEQFYVEDDDAYTVKIYEWATMIVMNSAGARTSSPGIRHLRHLPLLPPFPLLLLFSAKLIK